MIIYRGPSSIDGAPIVVLVPASVSTNRKTGAMLQTYILRADVAPTEAVKTGADSSICGDCRHRGDGAGKGRTCYVNIGQGALSTWKAFKAGRHVDLSDDLDAIARLGSNRKVRLGTYGDPAAVPPHVWHTLLSMSAGHTGYTHQWRAFADYARRPSLRPLVMASVDSVEEAREAQAQGWSTFRVRMPSEGKARLSGEAQCPAAKEVGAKVTCSQCMACDGDGHRRSRVITAHGGTAVMANVRRIDVLQIAD